MSGEELRQAAALMRERAEAATPGLWKQTGLRVPRRSEWMGLIATREQTEIALCYGASGGSGDNSDAEHIASWHPAVALAVADWLDGVALFVEAKDDEEYFDLDGDPIAPEDTHAIGSALDVARIYLGIAS